ncbi:MAG: hypothetical protein GW762_04580 [Candidatus Pacebacteria bacterium]|nr:hypothetical protein [Candidatus Paceibacterota bacterium]PIR63191.1 MAG: hypothetical protein COU64_05745 [Candidatus Pacebacteria bacterium CG10_big_fil_rev_8_21_14_0_10_40_26]PIZ78221.1 MAG: hypothetical protein COY01_05565 [Candidatus Pacebacteria bacterium CG_4_10_14_0_2_um_filter_40_20]PJA68734.1 MAG: hypothetical protein CO156_04480 [Candidatus Pacebacteria bacterium CG_4_9_14_3_um_filter_40_12]PJC41674.1 MAG: hypothetical protein CO041_03070 [Candidatus Pacebacteria bacterium CG_4_9_
MSFTQCVAIIFFALIGAGLGLALAELPLFEWVNIGVMLGIGAVIGAIAGVILEYLVFRDETTH